MQRIAVIGPESTGKSTLARYLASRYGGVLIEEYARQYVEHMEAEGKSPWTDYIQFEDVCAIAEKQIEQMQLLFAQQGEGVQIFDTELIVTKIWMEYAFGRVPKWIEEALYKYKMDVYLLTYPDIEWQADPARTNGGDEIRKELFERYEQQIQQLDIPYYIIRHCH